MCEEFVKRLTALAVELRGSEPKRPDDFQLVSNKATDLARALHQEDPLRRYPQLASTLHTLHIPLHSTESLCLLPGAPCAARRNAHEMHIRLYELDPEAHSISLGKALVQLGERLEMEGASENAVVCKAEGVAITYPLYEANRLAYREDLANFLDSYGTTLHASEQFENACAAKEDAVTLRREMASGFATPGTPSAFFEGTKQLELLVRSLGSLGVSLYETKRFENACAAHEEAVMLLRKLYARDPTAYHQQLAQSLVSYSSSLNKARSFTKACDASSEAVDLQRQLFEVDAVAHGPSLAVYLDQYGIALHSAGRIREECSVKEQAVALARFVNERDPTITTRASLAKLLFSLGVSLDKAGDVGQACEAKGKSVHLQRATLRDTGDAKQTTTLIKYLVGFSHTLKRAGRGKDARMVDEDIALLRQLGLSESDVSDRLSSISSRVSERGAPSYRNAWTR